MPEDLSQKDKEALELGKKIQAFFDHGYVNKKQALGFSFLKGMATGVGALVGGTIVAGLLIWALSGFKNLPLVGPITNQVQEALQKKDK
jgi:hypothetical protein